MGEGMRLEQVLRISLVLFMVVSASGCAAFRGDKLPEVQGWPPVSQSGKKSLQVSVGGSVSSNGKQIQDVSKVLSGWTTQTLKAYEESGLFSSASTSAMQESDLKIDVKVHYKSEYNEKLGMLLGLSFGLAALVIPQKSSGDYLLRTTIHDREGKEVAFIEKSESVSTWIQLFLLFAMPFRDGPGTVEKNVLYDLNRASILEAHGKGLF